MFDNFQVVLVDLSSDSCPESNMFQVFFTTCLRCGKAPELQTLCCTKVSAQLEAEVAALDDEAWDMFDGFWFDIGGIAHCSSMDLLIKKP